VPCVRFSPDHGGNASGTSAPYAFVARRISDSKDNVETYWRLVESPKRKRGLLAALRHVANRPRVTLQNPCTTHESSCPFPNTRTPVACRQE
jgi:hypothetical protein